MLIYFQGYLYDSLDWLSFIHLATILSTCKYFCISWGLETIVDTRTFSNKQITNPKMEFPLCIYLLVIDLLTHYRPQLLKIVRTLSYLF